MRDHGSSAGPGVQKFAQQMSDLVTAAIFVPQRYSGHSQFVQVSQRDHHTTEVVPLRSAPLTNQFSALGRPLGQNSRSGIIEDSSEPPGADLDAMQ